MRSTHPAAEHHHHAGNSGDLDIHTSPVLADAVGRPDRVRAVAAAVGSTPIPIIIPGHRVLVATGELTGYIGGLHGKHALLELEAATARHEPPPAVWAHRQLSLV